MTDQPRAALRDATHALAVTAAALSVLLPRSRYDWVRDVAPDIDPSQFRDDGANRALMLAVLLGAALVLELVAVATARGRRERGVAVALSACVAVTALLRMPT